MLRRDLQLAADVVFAKLAEKFLIRIIEKIIISDSRTNKNSLYALDPSKLSKKLKIVAVGYFKVFAGLWIEALPVLAYSVFKLTLAGGCAEVRCRAAHIVNVPLKSGERG